jgi:hypothetical protein
MLFVNTPWRDVGGSRGKAPVILNQRCSWRWVVRSRLGGLRNRHQHTEYGDGYASEPVWALEDGNMLLLPGIEPWSLVCSPSSLHRTSYCILLVRDIRNFGFQESSTGNEQDNFVKHKLTTWYALVLPYICIYIYMYVGTQREPPYRKQTRLGISW